jgi:hypothetical protein
MFFNFDKYKLFCFVFFLKYVISPIFKRKHAIFLKKFNIPDPSRLRAYILIAFNNAEYSNYLFLRLYKKRF